MLQSCLPWISEISSNTLAVLSNPSEVWSLPSSIAHYSPTGPPHSRHTWHVPPQNSFYAFTQGGTTYPPASSPSFVCEFNSYYYLRSSSSPPPPSSFLHCFRSRWPSEPHLGALPHPEMVKSGACPVSKSSSPQPTGTPFPSPPNKNHGFTPCAPPQYFTQFSPGLSLATNTC